MNACSKTMRQGRRWRSRTSTPTGSLPSSSSASSAPAPRSAASCGWPRSGACCTPRPPTPASPPGPATPCPACCIRTSPSAATGTPAVSAFAPEPVAAALGVSTLTGMKLIADALDLQHRLPKIWRLVEAPGGGAVEGPPGRPGHPRVVQGRRRRTWTTSSPRGWPPAGSPRSRPRSRWRSPSTTPSSSSNEQKQGRKGWHVTLRHPAPGDFDGTSYLDVAGDTLDLTAFHDLVLDQAAALKALGDTDDLEIRKAKALGVIATQQATLDLALPHRRRRHVGDRARREPPGHTSRRPGSTSTCP